MNLEIAKNEPVFTILPKTFESAEKVVCSGKIKGEIFTIVAKNGNLAMTKLMENKWIEQNSTMILSEREDPGCLFRHGFIK